MQLYRNVGGELDKTRSKLVNLISASLILNLIVVSVFGINFISRNTKEYYSSIETCFKAMTELISINEDKDFNKELFNKSVLKEFRKNKAKFNFKRVQLVKYLNSSSCEVVVKDNKGFRNYQVDLEHNKRFKHFFKVADIRGKKITSKYQVTSMGGF